MYQSGNQNNQMVKEEPITSPPQHQPSNHYLVYGNELVYGNHQLVDHRNWHDIMAQFHHQQHNHHYPHCKLLFIG